MTAGRDPLVASHFSLDVQGLTYAFFKEGSGFNNSTEVITHKATDPQGRAVYHKVPGDLTWDDITLRRGVTDSMDLWTWRQQVIDGKVVDARKDGTITIFNQEDTPIAQFNFINGWPSSWKGPDVNAEDNSIAIEEITLAHEGLVRVI